MLRAAFLMMAALSFLAAQDVSFTPIAMDTQNSETHTGLWLRPDLGKAEDILPLKTRTFATRESVTGSRPAAPANLQLRRASTRTAAPASPSTPRPLVRCV